MERFLHLATENLSLRYKCAKCAADLNLKNPRGLFGKKYLIFETVDEVKILYNPIISLRNLCGAFGSQMRLTCAECNAKLGYTVKKKHKIHLDSVNMISESNTEAETEKPELEQQGGLTESNAQTNSVELPVSERDAELDSRPEMNLASEPVKEFEAGQPKPKEIKEEEGESSGQLPPVISHQAGIKEYETLKSELTRLSKENDELKTRMEDLSEREKERIKEKKKMEEQMLKGGARFVSMVRRIELLNKEVKSLKKESELALKKEKEINGSLVFELEKMKVELETIKTKEKPSIEIKMSAIKAKDEEKSEKQKGGPLTELNAQTDSVQFPGPEREAELNSEPVKEAESGQIAEILQPKPEIEEGSGFMHVEQPELKPSSSEKKEEAEGSRKKNKKKRKKNKNKNKNKKTKQPQAEQEADTKNN